MRHSRIAMALVVATVACLPARYSDPNDAMLDGDWLDPIKGVPAEIMPGAGWWRPGRDREFGTLDDLFLEQQIGDVDLVVRTGTASIGTPIGAPHGFAGAPTVRVAPFGAGDPIAFAVTATTSALPPELGAPTSAPSLEGVPVLVVAFADLDGDGIIGLTEADGEFGDFELEEAELVPVGRTIAFAHAGLASGGLRVAAGGPAGAPLTIAVGAAAWAGGFDPSYQNGVVPRGPLVATHLPFRPLTAPDDVLDVGPAGPGPASADGYLGVRLEAVAEPDPAHPQIGESYALALDGSRSTTDLAVARAGAFARIGVVQRPDPLTYVTLPSRALRPGLDDTGARVLYEVLGSLRIADDGNATSEPVRLVPLDALGNVADLPSPQRVVLRVTPPLRVVSPDSDGDPHSEAFVISDALGVDAEIDDDGAAFDDVNAAELWVDGATGLFRLTAFLPDPDVDDSGSVTAADVAAVDARRGLSDDEAGFDSIYDLSGDGRIDSTDRDSVARALGRTVAVP